MTTATALTVINAKTTSLDRAYVAGLNGRKVGLYARTLAMAKQRAVEHFRPKKKNLGLVWVELAEEA